MERIRIFKNALNINGYGGLTRAQPSFSFQSKLRRHMKNDCNILDGYFIVSVEKFHIDDIDMNLIEFSFKIAKGELNGNRITRFYCLDNEKDREEANGLFELCGFDPNRGKFLNQESYQKRLKGIRLKLFIADKVFKVCERIK
jgi:hypothetical protein